MKTLQISLFLIGGILFSSNLFSQYFAIPDSICINEGEMIDLNVFTNDIVEGNATPMLEFSQNDECFFVDQEGFVRSNPDAPESCCGTHTLTYFACVFLDFDGDGEDEQYCDEAPVTIVVKCGKPDCSLFNLMDFQSEDPAGEGAPSECVDICEFSNTTFYVPYNTNNSYSWNVNTNGGSTSAGANPAEINVTWGPNGAGNVQLQVTNPAGIVQTISLCVNLMLGPTADFTSDGYTCLNSPISFTNLSSNASEYDWDFGDGNFVNNVFEPTHQYDTPGTYTVTLYATQFNYDDNGNQLCCCTDSVSYDVIVDPLPGPNIYWISTLCEGDSSKYWTDASNCSTYDWFVTNTNGDTLPFTGQGTDTICVLWNPGFDGIISLDVDGCDSTYCDNPTTVTVPIIPNVSQVEGPDEVCVNSTHVYSLPKWLSTEYNWTVLDVNGDPVPFDGQGGHQININWTVAGISSIHVDYSSEFLNGIEGHTGVECSGVADLSVNVKPFFALDNPQTLACAGGMSFINATSFPSSNYLWTVSPPVTMTGQGTANLSLTWDAGPGTYTVTASPNDPSIYCNDIETIIFEVVDLPPPLSIEGPDSICAGDQALYTVNTSETGVGFIWNISGGSPVFSNSSSVLVTWAGAGSLSVYQYLLAAPGCSSDPISKNVIEKAVEGPLNVSGSAACTNSISTYTLTPPQIGDADITWSIDALTDGSIISGQGTEVIQVQWNNDPGEVTVDVDVIVCGNLASFSLIDTIYSPVEPIISQTGILCPGVMAELSTQGGFSSYSWSNGSASDTAMISTGGNYSVTTIDGNGCTATAYYNANEVVGPVANISSGDYPNLCIGDGESVNIVALTNAGYNFEWFCNNVSQGPSSPTANLLHTNTDTVQDFDYYFEVTDTSTGCMATSDIFEVSQDSCIGSGPGCTPEAYSINPSAMYTNVPPYCDELQFFPGLSANASVAFWSFGDGNTSTENVPIHSYDEAGCYNVWLTALVPSADGSGDSCLVRSDFEVCVEIVADFSFQYLGCGDVQFTDLTTYIDSVGPIMSWSWREIPPPPPFTAFSASQNPIENFGPGTHTIRLTVSLPNGCTSMVLKDIEIGTVNIDSISAASIPDPPCVGDAVTFSTIAPGAVDWFWDFGDGATFSGASPVHSYNTPGSYTVTLTVMDADGCTDTDTISVIVHPGIPDGLQIVPGTSFICEGDTLTLSAPAGYTYLWSTGETTQTIDVYEEDTYSVVITDANGCFLELDGVDISVYPAPIAAISGNPIICDAGCTNLFALQAPGLMYSWSNGSGTTGGNTPILTVCAGSINNPYTLTVTDANGCSSTSDPIEVEVAISPSFVVDISPDPCEGKAITLTINPVEPDVNYNWSNGETGTSIVVYQAGTYTAIGTNINSGCSFSASAIVNPLPDLCLVPVGCYEVCDPDTICGPLGLSSYTWLLDGNFTPGIPGMEHCVEAVVSGTYMLVASNEFGCVDTSGALILEVINCDSAQCDDLVVDFDYQLNQTNQPDSCCASLSYANNSFDLQGMVIRSTDADLNFDISSIDPSLTLFGSTINSLTLTDIVPGNPIPSSISGFVDFCIGEVYNYPQEIIIDWYDFDSEIACSDTLIFHCPIEPECLYLENDSIYCVDGLVFYDMTICNPHTNNFDVTYINFNVFAPPGILITPPALTIPTLAPGNCYTTTVQLDGTPGNDIAGELFCYTLTAHSADPTVVDTALCCTFEQEYCIEIPICDPCEYVGIEGIQLTDSAGCCYQVDIYNNYDPLYFDEIALCVISPNTSIASINNFLGSPWITSAPTSTSVSFLPTAGTLPLGVSSLPEICFDTDIAPSQSIEIKWLKDGEIVCRDTTEINCHPNCGYFEEESITCNSFVNGLWDFSGTLFNNTNYQIDEILISSSDPAVLGMAYLVNISPFTSFSTIDFNIGAPGQAGDTICFYVSMRSYTPDGDYLECCFFEHCIVLPPCDFIEPSCICEDPEFNDHVLNGITCVQDAFNPNLFTFQLTDFLYFQECDEVFWDFGDGNFVSSIGGAPVMHEYGSIDPQKVCVRVERTDDFGNKCNEKTCKSLVDKDDPNFLIYPNPTSGLFNVVPKIDIKKDMIVEIRDVNNRPILSKVVLYENSNANIEIDVTDLSTGLYYIHFITNENHWVEKISKQ